MGNFFARIASGIQTKAVNPGYFSPNDGLRMIGGQVALYGPDKDNYIDKGYAYNDILYSIIHLILEKAKIAPWAVYVIKDEKAYGQLQAIRKQLHIPGNAAKAKDLHCKAMEIYQADGRLNELLEYPNPTQTFSDLNENLMGFKLITGDYYEFWQMAEGGLNSGKPLTLSVLPSQFTMIKASNTIPQYEEEYTVNLGRPIIFSREEILHEKYFNPDWDVIGGQLYGMSPLRAGLRRLQRNNEAQVAGISAFRNSGARGIISPDTDNPAILKALTWEQVDAMKQRIRDEIGGGSRSSGRTAILNAPYKYTQIGFSPVDLDMLKSENVDMRMLCNIYGVPSQLLNDPENKSYNNASEGEKALTARCAIPLLNSRRDSFNRKLQSLPAYKGKAIRVDYDQTVYSELEENRKDQAEWMAKAWNLTPRQRFELQGIEIPAGIPDEVLDTMFIPGNLVPAQDLLTGAEDLEEAAKNLKDLGLNDYI